MTGRDKVRRDFVITVQPEGETPPALRVEFTPRGQQAGRESGRAPRRIGPFVVRVLLQDHRMVADWEAAPLADSKVDRNDLEQEAAQRLSARIAWLGLLSDLVNAVEGLTSDLGWATQRVPKKVKDAEIGEYQTCALLMQQGTTRVLLEPVGRGGPASEGVVDLYLVPAYDDIASLN
jgi:hypothetical protein